MQPHSTKTLLQALTASLVTITGLCLAVYCFTKAAVAVLGP